MCDCVVVTYGDLISSIVPSTYIHRGCLLCACLI